MPEVSILDRIVELNRGPGEQKIDPKTSGQHVSAIRGYLKLSVLGFAAALEVNPVTVKRWENGEIRLRGQSLRKVVRLVALRENGTESRNSGGYTINLSIKVNNPGVAIELLTFLKAQLLAHACGPEIVRLEVRDS